MAGAVGDGGTEPRPSLHLGACGSRGGGGGSGDEGVLRLHFEGEADDVEGFEVEPWVSERFEYFGRLSGGSWAETTQGAARMPCRRVVFETFLKLATKRIRAQVIPLPVRMEMFRFADMIACPDVVLELARSIRQDYLSEGDGARDNAVMILCELADLLTPTTDSAASVPVGLAGSPPVAPSSQQLGLGAATASPSAIWLVSTAAVAPSTSVSAASQAGTQAEQPQQQLDPCNLLREACLEALPGWTRQRFTETPKLWRLQLEDVLAVYGSEAPPRSESSWLALHAARLLHPDILPFASADTEMTQKLAKEHPEIERATCVSLCIQEVPFSKTVSGFGGTDYQIQVWMSPTGGGWVLGVGGHGLCALRRVELVLDLGNGRERHDLAFTGLMEHLSTDRLEDTRLGFNSDCYKIPLPFCVELWIYEYPLHLAVQTYIGFNFRTMALLCQGFEFGPMDLACVMDLWLQSDHLRRVPEVEIASVVRRTLGFVKLTWPPVVRVSFVVCMHSCWPQAVNDWWHRSLINSCVDMQVWEGPMTDGVPGSSTFKSYISQVVQHALGQYPQVFVTALQGFFRTLPSITLSHLTTFFKVPESVSDPFAIMARHYLTLLRAEEEQSARRNGDASQQTDAGAEGGAGGASGELEVRGLKVENSQDAMVLQELLQGLCLLVGPAMERSQPRTVLLAFLTLAGLCDRWHQRRLCSESLGALLQLDRPTEPSRSRFWATTLMALLEFSSTLTHSRTSTGGRGTKVKSTP